MPDTIFDPKEDETPAPDPVETPDDPVAALVGEGKKFKTIADLAKGKMESDAFVARLLAEQKELRDDLKARKNLEDLAAELKRTQQAPKASASSEDEPTSANETKTAITPAEIKKLLDEELTTREQTQRANKNLNLVKTKLQETLGSDFSKKSIARAQKVDPSLTANDLQNLAARNPNALFKLLDVPVNPTNVAPPVFSPSDSSVNTSGFSPTVSTERTRSWYNKLKAENREKYYSPAMRQQMYNDAMKLGEKFEDV